MKANFYHVVLTAIAAGGLCLAASCAESPDSSTVRSAPDVSTARQAVVSDDLRDRKPSDDSDLPLGYLSIERSKLVCDDLRFLQDVDGKSIYEYRCRLINATEGGKTVEVRDVPAGVLVLWAVETSPPAVTSTCDEDVVEIRCRITVPFGNEATVHATAQLKRGDEVRVIQSN
jgi:hypothetical protein